MPRIWSHIAAFLTIGLWGVTFVSTKSLLSYGFKPINIFEIRFLIAYLCMWGLCIGKFGLFRARPGKRTTRIWCDSIGDELGMAFCGFTGGSLYFVTENNALGITSASIVSFIVCTAPLLTMLLTLFCKRFLTNCNFVSALEEVKVKPSLIVGTFLAIGGMAMVIFDGADCLSFNGFGGILAFAAALSWAIYSLKIGSLTLKYGSIMTTRKVFFYGILTGLPFLDYSAIPSMSMFTGPAIFHLLFLSVIASFACFAVWNAVMHSLGNVTATNYVYFNPVFTLISAMIFLGERLSPAAAVGCAAILLGVVMSGMPKIPLFQRSFMKRN